MKRINLKMAVLAFLMAYGTYFYLHAANTDEENSSDPELENLVKRSYQYVALFNTINNFVISDHNPFATGGWNKTHYPTGLMDASVKALPRPNNDTLYVLSTLDLRDDAVVINYPVFNSRYVSLETSALDHYCDIPLATSKGDFKRPTKIMFYSDLTKGYSGEPVKGVDQIFKMSGDYAIAFLRVMPEAQDPLKFKANMAAIKQVKLQTLNEFLGKPVRPSTPEKIPEYGNDAMVFANNFQEAMQFVFNHLTFDPNDQMDQQALAAMKRVGVEPGKQFNSNTTPKMDYKRLSTKANEVATQQDVIWNDPEKVKKYMFELFLPKGEMNINAMVLQSVIGPLGQPASQAIYSGITTENNKPMNAMHDYVVRMKKDELPPAIAFWSLTLYDTKQGFFIPNKENKYSVGQNAGMKLNAEGGIEIYIAAEQPEGVPKENWLPINREDIGIDLTLRVYQPNLQKMKTWQAPKAIQID